MVSVHGFVEAAQHAVWVGTDSNAVEMCSQAIISYAQSKFCNCLSSWTVDPPPSGAPWAAGKSESSLLFYQITQRYIPDNHFRIAIVALCSVIFKFYFASLFHVLMLIQVESCVTFMLPCIVIA